MKKLRTNDLRGCRWAPVIVLITCCLLVHGSCLAATAGPIQILRVPKGQTVDLWFGVNVTGKVNVVVRTRDGRNTMKLWWITWGVGSTREVGEWGPQGALDIPITWWKGIVSAKLRGEASDDTVVYASDQVNIDKTVTFAW